MALLGRAVIVRAISRVMVFEESHSAVFPRQAIGGIADHPNSVAKSVQSCVVSGINRLQAELASEIKYAAGGFHVICVGDSRIGCCLPNPTTLLGMLVPIVFTHGKRRLRQSVIKCDPLSLVPVNHIVAPPPIAERLQLE